MVASLVALLLPALAQALPEGYTYEKVSPADKGNGEVAGGTLRAGSRSAAFGDRVMYPSDGAFAGATGITAGNAYFAQRDAEGWTTDAVSGLVPYLLPTNPIIDPGPGNVAPQGLSADGRKTVVQTNVDPDTGAEIPGAVFLLDLVTRDTERVSPPPVAGPPNVNQDGGFGYGINGTSDFSTLLYSTAAQLTADSTLAPVNFPKLYRYVGGESELASYLPDGSPHSGVLVDSVADDWVGPNSVSDDGSVWWWSAGTFNSPPRIGQLFRGEAGTQSSAFINESENTGATVPPARADFWGASADGERAVFTSGQLLTDDATGTTTNLYLYTDSDNPEADQNLTLLSKDSEPDDGDDPRVADVLGVSDDAKTIYFTAMGQLVDGQPATAGEKIYRWHQGEGSTPNSLDYLATASAAAVPPGVTPDGRYLMLRSSGDLTADDNGGFSQIYLYDSQDDEWACASCVPGGVNTSGPLQDSFNVLTITQEPRRMLSDDGRVIFTTADSLLREDTNGKKDVYTYKDGQLDLVSSGRATSDVRFADATADGSRIYFITRAKLSGWDEDNRADLYVARVGDGLPEPNVRPESPCTGDDCQGPSPEGPGDEIGTGTYEGPGNQARACRAEKRSAQRAQRKAKRVARAQRSTAQRAKRLQRQAHRAFGKHAKRLERRADRQDRKARRLERKQRRLKRSLTRHRSQLRACRGRGR